MKKVEGRMTMDNENNKALNSIIEPFEAVKMSMKFVKLKLNFILHKLNLFPYC